MTAKSALAKSISSEYTPGRGSADMKRKRLLSVLIALTLVFIWGNSLVPRETSGALSDGLMEILNEAALRLGLGENFFTFMMDQDGDGIEEPTSHIVRKAAHVTEFAVLGALIWLRLELPGRKRDLVGFALGAAVGVSDEVLQFFSHRGSQLKDVVIDACGVLLGLCAVKAAAALRRRKGRM